MRTSSLKIHPAIIAIVFIILSVVLSVYAGILFEKTQIFFYQYLLNISLYQGGYIYFVGSSLLLFWTLGFYYVLKKKIILLLLLPTLLLFLLGFFQRIVLNKDALIITSPFFQKKIFLNDINKLTIKYVETKTNECSDFFYLTTKEEEVVTLENLVFPAEKLFKDIKSSHDIPVTCEFYYWMCDYQKYPSFSNLSSNRLCEELVNFANNN